MSVLSNLRDTISALSLEVALRDVRERQLRRLLLDDNPMTEQELRAAEREVVLATARLMYCDETAQAMGIVASAGRLDHRKDYASRATASADLMCLWTHQLLCRLPVVGDPAFAAQ